jgi:hypothetical protein
MPNDLSHLQMYVGFEIIATESGDAWKAGEKFKIAFVEQKGGHGPNIAITSEKARSGFHNLDGRCKDNHGYYLDYSSFQHRFEVVRQPVEISGSASFRKQELRGLKGKILHTGKEEVLVELEKDVGAGSGDGMGRKGHCVVVSSRNVRLLTPNTGKKRQAGDSVD